MKTDFVLDALEQALHQRKDLEGLIHHSDRGSQYVAFRYTDRLIEAGIERSIGSVGDSYDNALAESINGLYKTEVIRKRGPWRGVDDVEMATLTWVDWFNNRRLLEPIGYVPPAEFEQAYYRSLNQEGIEGTVPEGRAASRSSIVEALSESISEVEGRDSIETPVSMAAASSGCQNGAVMGAALN